MTTPQFVTDQTKGHTIPKLVHRNATEYGDLPAVTSLDLEGRPTLSWSQFRDEVAIVSRGLADLGLSAGQRMLIMAPNSPNHLVVDLAAAHVAAISCTAYSTLSPDQVRYVARHSAAEIVVLAGAAELKRWQPVLDDLSSKLRAMKKA